MKQRLSRGELVFWSVLAALALANLIAFVLLLPAMPDQLPTHWGISGAVDDWSDKEVTIVLAAMPLVFVALLFIVPRIDPKRRNFASFSGIYRSFTAAICLLLMAVTWMGPLTAWGYLSPDSGIVSTLLFGFFGLLFIGLGNYMPRIRPNFTFGIRTPWTLASEEVWRSTHRASGPVFVVAGIATLIAALVATSMPTVTFAVMLISVLGATAFAGVYSYLQWRKLAA